MVFASLLSFNCQDTKEGWLERHARQERKKKTRKEEGGMLGEEKKRREKGRKEDKKQSILLAESKIEFSLSSRVPLASIPCQLFFSCDSNQECKKVV